MPQKHGHKVKLILLVSQEQYDLLGQEAQMQDRSTSAMGAHIIKAALQNLRTAERYDKFIDNEIEGMDALNAPPDFVLEDD